MGPAGRPAASGCPNLGSTDVAGTLTVGAHEIGDHTPCYVIAEIGHNHQGSVDKARELFREAKLAGADAVKPEARQPRPLHARGLQQTV